MLPFLSKEVIETWPSTVPVVFVGYEDADWIRTGTIIRENHDFLWSPVKRSVDWFCTIMHFWCPDGGLAGSSCMTATAFWRRFGRAWPS